MRRVLAFEDGPFTSSRGEKASQAALLGVEVVDSRIGRLLTAWIAVDGLDVTERMVEMASSFRPPLDAILLHGLPYAGFNIVEALRLNAQVGVPVLAVLGVKPRREAVEGALRRHFADWERRLDLLDAAGTPIHFELSLGSHVYYQAVGLDGPFAETLIRALTVFGKVPEPLRIARILAEALVPWTLEEAGR